MMSANNHKSKSLYRPETANIRQQAKKCPSLPLGNPLYIWLGLYSRGKLFIRRVRKRKISRPVCIVKQNKLFFVYDFFY